MRQLFLLFVKWPEAGKVKTRIAQVVGNERAADIYRELVRRVLVNLQPILSEVEAVWMVFDPPERAEQVRDWLEKEAESAGWDLRAVEFLPQVPGDLGTRLRAAFERGFEVGFEQVAVAGTDCVEMGAGQVVAAFRAEADVVFGPARDGGYYLARLNGVSGCAVFDGVPWSSQETLASSVRAAEGAGLGVELLEELGDVDTIEDWQRVEEMDRTALRDSAIKM